MPANRDFKELFCAFNEENVEYLVVGAHAYIFYAEPRYTKDLDIWVNPTEANARRVLRALAKFGAPLADVSPADLTNPEMVLQIGVEPNRFDILMGITGVDFEPAWTNRSPSTYDGIPINILGKVDLIRNKRACGRPKDMIDIERLEKD